MHGIKSYSAARCKFVTAHMLLCQLLQICTAGTPVAELHCCLNRAEGPFLMVLLGVCFHLTLQVESRTSNDEMRTLLVRQSSSRSSVHYWARWRY